MTTAIIALLLIFTVIREWLFWNQTQLLVNKLMSRDYATYQTAQASAKMEPHQPTYIYPDEAEDLRPLTGIG